MADKDHLKLIKKGVAVWNKNRKINTSKYSEWGWNSYRANLAGASLIRASLPGANLFAADLSEADLYEVDLSNANLYGANLNKAELTRANLNEADLSHADLSFANLAKANLFKVILKEANLSDAKLSLSDLRGANLSNANLSNADLHGVKLSGANLSGADLTGSNLSHADLSNAKLDNVKLVNADLRLADLSSAVLTGADLQQANLFWATLGKTNLTGANLTGACLFQTDLTMADLTDANLKQATLVETNISEAKLTNCSIYGLSAWNLKGLPVDQSNLIITTGEEAVITVDDLQLAQFIYLLLNNKNVRNIIDTITSKVILILGRFTEDRLTILEAIREQLRKQNFTPILFDFDKPASKDVTGTVETLARLARFIIADLTQPSSIPHELATLVPHLRTTPIQPIKLAGTTSYSMIEDYYGSYKWLLKTHEYKNSQSLIEELQKIIAPANEMAEGFKNRDK